MVQSKISNSGSFWLLDSIKQRGGSGDPPRLLFFARKASGIPSLGEVSDTEMLDFPAHVSKVGGIAANLRR
jgi:hypothetical protein